MATSYLTKTFGSSGNKDKWTWSAWVKRSGIGSATALFGVSTGGGNFENLTFRGGDDLDWENYQSSTYKYRLLTNRKFRDPSAWYHIVAVYDSVNVTAGNRCRLYINGIEETSFATDTNPTSGEDSLWNNDYQQQIGADGSGGQDWNGCMSHIHFCDGYAYAASDFGEFDSTSGIWKIKTSPSVSYGTNGYFILKDGAVVTDSSPNSNNWTIYEYVLATKDNPSNSFATLNSLNMPTTPKPVFSKGNNTVVTQNASGKYFGGTSTLGMVGGKWYCEFKADSLATDGMVGINGSSSEQARQNGQMSYTTSGFGYMNDGSKSTNLTDTSYGNSWTTANVIGCAVDLDNLKIYFAKDNTWQDSGDPTSGATGTGAAFTILAASATPEGFYAFGCGDKSTGSSTLSVNFGNGYFGTTAVTSAEADGAGIGAFEYAPPTGYYALCTKNIKAYGG